MAIQQVTQGSGPTIMAVMFGGEDAGASGKQFNAALAEASARPPEEPTGSTPATPAAPATASPATPAPAPRAGDAQAADARTSDAAAALLPDGSAAVPQDLAAQADTGKDVKEAATAAAPKTAVPPAEPGAGDTPAATPGETALMAPPAAAEDAPLPFSEILHEDTPQPVRTKDRGKPQVFGQDIAQLITLVNEAIQAPPPAPSGAADALPARGQFLPAGGKNLPPLPAGPTFSRTGPAPGATAFARDFSVAATPDTQLAQDFGAVVLPEAAAFDLPPATGDLALDRFAALGLQAAPATETLMQDAAPLVDAPLDVPQLQSSGPVGSEEWLLDLGAKVDWLQDMQVQTAELRLHPAELGSLEIRIVTEDDGTRISFVTQTAAARDAIESTLPRLRELLAHQGLQLDQSSVSQQSAESFRRGQQAPAQAQRNGAQFSLAPDESRELNRRIGRALEGGRINHYV